MTVIITKYKDALPFPALNRLALKKIYEPEKMTKEEETQLMESIVNWKNHLDLKHDMGMFDTDDREDENMLGLICWNLKRDEDGELDKRKEWFKKHGIDWRKFHRLPEAYQESDFAKAKYYHSLLPKEEQ